MRFWNLFFLFFGFTVIGSSQTNTMTSKSDNDPKAKAVCLAAAFVAEQKSATNRHAHHPAQPAHDVGRIGVLQKRGNILIPPIAQGKAVGFKGEGLAGFVHDQVDSFA